MKGIFFWLVPPIVGAFIGCITNYVAIKMLFRPLKEARIFGFRLPFTPGILPRERAKLADSIGRMVEQELLTSEVLRERLARSEVRGKIGSAMSAYTGQMIERPLSYWLEDRPANFPLAEALNDFVHSDVFDSFLEEIIRSWIMGKASSGDDYSLASWLSSRFRDFGAALVPAARILVKGGLAKEIKNQARGEGSSYRQALEKIVEKYSGISTREFLSLGAGKKRLFDSFLAEKAADTLDGNIEAALSSIDVKALVSDRINSLDMLRVEKIILDVMAGQLKWITVFGAILGALIGFVQVFLSLISPGMF